jgi:hypothetical protein
MEFSFSVDWSGSDGAREGRVSGDGLPAQQSAIDRRRGMICIQTVDQRRE